jgi:hypothetical protein
MSTALDAPPSGIDAKFWKFHEDNPHVFDELVRLSDQARARHRKKIGMKMLFEVIRWNSVIRTKGDIFKLNNSYAPRYVRLIEERRPDLIGLFEKRSMKS